MEFFIKVLIYIHAFFGGLGLFSGIASLYFRKGRTRHRNAGQIFTLSMIISSGIALIIAILPNHQNGFLFFISLLTIYLILAGNRVLTFRDNNKLNADSIDRGLSYSMFVASLIAMIIGLISWTQNSDSAILYAVFSGLGILLSISDFKFYKRYKQEKLLWLKSHIGRMVGALIASFTAFIVTGLHLNKTIFWIAPTVIGTILIKYWTKKVSKRRFYRRSL